MNFKEMAFPIIEELSNSIKCLCLDDMEYYLLTYPAFVNFFKENPINRQNVLIGYGFTYSWMPTIPKKVDDNCLEESVKILEKVQQDFNLEQTDMKTLKETFNNSIVGVSKLLHFICPEHFPIWDSNVAKAVKLSNHKVNTIEAFFEYRKTCCEYIKKDDFNDIHKRVSEKLKIEVTPMRALEIVLFSIGKKKTKSNSTDI